MIWKVGNLGTSGLRGTAIYVKNDIPSVEMKILDSTYKDSIWVEILLNKTESLLCGCIYRSKNDKDEMINSLEELEKVLSAAVEMKKSHLIIAGDFNLKGINWEIDFAEDKQHHLQEFINVLHDNFLYQHARQPTHHRLGENSNILDVVFSNEEGLVSPIEHYSGLGKSDHECLVFNVICNKQLITNNSTRRNIFKANFTEIEKHLERVDSILTGEISEAYKRFCEALDKATEGNIPVVKGNFKQKKNLFMTKEALRLRKSKNKH